MKENNVNKQSPLEEQFMAVFTPNPERHIVCGGLGPDGRKLIETRIRPATLLDVRRHLNSGNAVPSLGYLPGTQNGSRCFMVDLDDDGRHFPAEQLSTVTAKVVEAAVDAGLSPFLEQSCSGRGTHVWVFFTEDIPYGVAHDAAKVITRRAGVPSVEVFPSGRSVAGKMPLLPYGGAEDNPFGEGTTFLTSPEGTPLSLATLREELSFSPVEAILALVERQESSVFPSSDLPNLLQLPLQHAPFKGNRHDAISAFLNVAERVNALDRMAEVLGSREVWLRWGADDSRTHDAWRAEVGRWTQNIRSGWNGAKRGYPYLRELGYDTGAVSPVSPVSAVSAVSASGEQWGQRKPIKRSAVAAPRLPVEAIPPSLRSWLTTYAEETATPPEVVAVVALGAVSILTGRTVQIRPSGSGTQWRVFPNLWALIVLPSGSMKSAILAEGLRPLRVVDEKQLAQHREKLPFIKAQLANVEKGIARSAKEDISEGDLSRLFARKINLEAQIRPPLLMPNDTTFERLGLHLERMPRGVAVVYDELGPLLSDAQNKDKDHYVSLLLTGWAGDQRFTFSRVTREDVTIDNACISVIGAVQPGPLQFFLERNGSGTKGDRGLLGRFQLTVWPDAIGEWEQPKPTDFTEIHAHIDRLAHRIDGLYRGSPTELRFAPEAQTLFDQWRDSLEKRLRSPNPYTLYQAHLGKYRSLLPSLAGIFHVLEAVSTETETVQLDSLIGEHHLKRALEWLDFLEGHARKLYGVVGGAPQSAIRLAEQIEIGLVTHEMSVRELRRKQWSGLRTTEECDTALDWLQKAGWLRVVEVPVAGTTVARRIRLHPELREG